MHGMTIACSNHKKFLTNLDNSNWLKNIRKTLEAAMQIVRAVAIDRRSVLVHCSDGWDRTSQICALSELMLDPHYRTIEGFATLIEKDWCAFGHKFHDRCMSLGKEWSPVFIQFLDCVYQIYCQFPRHFEFNLELLVLLADAAYVFFLFFSLSFTSFNHTHTNHNQQQQIRGTPR